MTLQEYHNLPLSDKVADLCTRHPLPHILKHMADFCDTEADYCREKGNPSCAKAWDKAGDVVYDACKEVQQLNL